MVLLGTIVLKMAKSIKDVQSWMEKVGFSEYCKAFAGIFLKNIVEFRLRASFLFFSPSQRREALLIPGASSRVTNSAQYIVCSTLNSINLSSYMHSLLFCCCLLPTSLLSGICELKPLITEELQYINLHSLHDIIFNN